MSYNVVFFDGKSSKSNKASLSTRLNTWEINYTDELGNYNQIMWQISKIKRSEAYTGDIVTFTYGKTFPFQKIESKDLNFIEYIRDNGDSNLNNKLDTFIHKSVHKSIAVILVIIFSFALAMHMYIIPTVSVNFTTNLSKQNVVSFGEYVFNLLSNDLDINDKKTKKLQDFVDQLEIKSDFPIKTYVSNNEELNAYAISGGKIIVHSGLLDKIKTEHQLAALIGHEVSHIENRHALKNLSRTIASTVFVSTLFGDVNSVTAILADNAHLFSQLSYSRELEKEADIYGIETIRNNNLDLNGMPQLFQLLKKYSNFDTPTYFSSHPELKDRIEYSTKIAEQQNHKIENKRLKQMWTELYQYIHKEDIIEQND